METTPTNPQLARPASPSAPIPSSPILSRTKPASPPTLPPNLLYANFAAHLLHTRPARNRPAPALTFSRALPQTLAVLRRAFETFWRTVVHRARPQKALRVAETASLGDRRFVAVVEFERQRFLIGASPSSITLLASLPNLGNQDGACQETNRVGTEPRPAQVPADLNQGGGR